jgi:MSHA biogenesis protein MshI
MWPFFKRKPHKHFSAVLLDHGGVCVASAASQSDGKPQLSHCEFLPLENQRPLSVEALKKRLKPLHLQNRPCATTMGLGDYTILSVEAPDVPVTELRAAVRWQIKDLIDFHIDDAVLDVFDAPASGADQRQHNLYVVVSRMSAVKQQIVPLQDAEINISVIDIPELVLRNICAYTPQDQDGLVFVYLAAEQGVIVITRQSTLYLARSMELGYSTLAKAAVAGGELDDGFNPEFDRLVLEVQRSLDYYDRYFSQPSVAGLLVAPTLEPIPGLTDYLTQSLGVSAGVMDLNEIIHCDTPIDQPTQARCLLAAGAALRQERTTL